LSFLISLLLTAPLSTNAPSIRLNTGQISPKKQNFINQFIYLRISNSLRKKIFLQPPFRMVKHFLPGCADQNGGPRISWSTKKGRCSANSRRKTTSQARIGEGRYALLTQYAANDTARAAMDGRENRQTNMDVILAVARRSRRESYGASSRSYGAGVSRFCKSALEDSFMIEMIKTLNLRHSYPGPDGTEVVALEDISLTVTAGEFVAVIGANGSGKSTLAKHFNALLVPTAGECLVEGLSTAVAENVWPIRQKVGMVFQNPDNQIVAAVVEEDVAFGPENLGVPPAEIAARVAEALELVGMSDYRYHGPHILSGGQKQRVAIAGVLAMRPKCLVLDEPTAMLDPLGRGEVLATVTRLNKEEGITVVYITHFMEEAVRADRVVVLDAGRVVRTGRPAEVFSRVAELKALGLDAPLAADVAARLRAAGLSVPDGVITDEELAVALCR
jgi:energy-coupling factor transport system ATP-binding protein